MAEESPLLICTLCYGLICMIAKGKRKRASGGVGVKVMYVMLWALNKNYTTAM